MRRRLDLAGALVAEPEVLFLDEPTTGLDPRSRIDMWERHRELVAGGTTLLLTTQYLEEADRLADDIVVIDHGRAIAQGTADAAQGAGGRRARRADGRRPPTSSSARGGVLAGWPSARSRVDAAQPALVAPVTRRRRAS